MTYTPGPWRLYPPAAHPNSENGDGYYTIDAGQGGIGDGFHFTAFMYFGDALLIAAAPDLLEAAKLALVKLVEDGWTGKEPLIKQIRKTIEKAEGRK